jgi:Tol biopolymer transport system component
MNANGSGATRLTNNTVIDTWPTWSADGTRIAFTSNRDGNYEIYVMSAGGSGVTRLTTAPGLDFEPAWSTQ